MTAEGVVIQGLVRRGLPLHIAQGIAANMIAESRLDPGINEIAPLVPGSRGGFGLNQWTGPRRRALESAAAARGVPVSDLDFQLDFTMEELRGPERRAWDALQGATSAEEAARLYSERFLRPGIPHLENRLAHARRIAGGDGDGGNALAMGQPAPRQGGDQQNALALAQRAEAQRQQNAIAMLERAQAQPLDVFQTGAPAPQRPQFQPRPFAAPAEFRPRSVRRQS